MAIIYVKGVFLMKKLIIVLCATMLLCFTGCKPEKKNNLTKDEIGALMDLLCANNPYREANSIVQLDFVKDIMRMDMTEKASATSWESYYLMIKDIYHTDQDNVYKLDITLGNDMYQLFITLVKPDATELILELPASQYKETYIPDRGFNTADLFAYLGDCNGWMNGAEEYNAKFYTEDDGSYKFAVLDNTNGNTQYMTNIKTEYIGINCYKLTGEMHIGNGPDLSDAIVYVKLMKDTNVINIKVKNDYFPIDVDFFRY